MRNSIPMARKKRQQQNQISDEMEARINSASSSDLEAIMAEAGHRYETAKEHLGIPPRTGSKRYQRRRAQRWPKGK